MTAATPRIPRDAYFLFIGLFLSVASNNLVTPLLPAIRHGVGMSVAMVGVYVSAYGMARLIVDLPSGALTVRLGPRRMIVVGVAFNAVASFLGSVATDAVELLVLRIFAGVGAGLMATVILAAMGDIAPPQIRGKVMSLYQVANNLGIAIYPLVGGVLGGALGWRSAFVAAAIAAAGAGLVLQPVLGRIAKTVAADTPDGIDGERRRAGRALILASGVIFFGVTASMVNRHGFRNTVMPLFASSHLGLSGVQIATGITVMSITGILVTIPAAGLGDRIGRNRIIVGGLTMLAVGDFIFPLVATNFVSYVVAGAVIGLGDCFASSQTAQLAGLVGPRQRSMILAAYRFFVDLGALVGPLSLAWLLGAFGADVAIRAAGGLLLLAAIVGAVGARTVVRDKAPLRAGVTV
jgi:MFS family permease